MNTRDGHNKQCCRTGFVKHAVPRNCETLSVCIDFAARPNEPSNTGRA